MGMGRKAVVGQVNAEFQSCMAGTRFFNGLGVGSPTPAKLNFHNASGSRTLGSSARWPYNFGIRVNNLWPIRNRPQGPHLRPEKRIGNPPPMRDLPTNAVHASLPQKGLRGRSPGWPPVAAADDGRGARRWWGKESMVELRARRGAETGRRNACQQGAPTCPRRRRDGAEERLREVAAGRGAETG